jgi:Family of unknown function (DUF5522)/Cysteine-rich CWC
MASTSFIICGRCNAPLVCKVDDIVNCECNKIVLSESTKSFLIKTNFGCLCNNCLKYFQDLVAQADDIDSKHLVNGLHYYIEGGFMVFTEIYHVNRGYCCKSGCRHCVYGYKYSSEK